MNTVTTERSAIGIAIAAILSAAVITVLLMISNPPNGSAEAAGLRPNSATPQVSVPDADQAALATLRKQAQNEDHRIDPNLNRSILDGKLDGLIGGSVSDSQRSILQDGVITFDEYRSAEMAWHTCMEDAGLSIPAFHLNGLALYNESIISSTDREKMDEAYAQCTAKYTGAIGYVWASVTVQLTQKMAEVQSAARAHCLDAAGFSLAEAKTEGNYAAEDANGQCIGAVKQATDTTGFLGG